MNNDYYGVDFDIFDDSGTFVGEYGILVLVAGLAVASKYIVAWRGRYYFHPAAFSGSGVTV